MIKSIFELLGLRESEEAAAVVSQVESTDIAEISARLEGFEEDRARYIVIFAMVLARAARADLEVSDNERWVMVQILREHAGLPEDQAELAVEMVATVDAQRKIEGRKIEEVGEEQYLDVLREDIADLTAKKIERFKKEKKKADEWWENEKREATKEARRKAA